MFNRIIEGIIKGFEQLLPSHDEKLIVWISKLATLTTIAALVLSGGFVALRETPIGVRWGINPPPPVMQLSNKEYRDIQTVLYTYLARTREEVPALRGVYFVAVFDKDGNINFADENYDRIGVFTWYSPLASYISFNTFEEVLLRENRANLQKLVTAKECTMGMIDKVGIERYKQAIPNFLSDRFVICPVPNNDARPGSKRLPFGAVIGFWVNDDKRPQVEAEALVSVKLASDNIGWYLLQRTDLNLNK